MSAAAPRQASCFSASWAERGEPLHLFDHEIDDVIGVAPGADAIRVPSPGRRGRIECEEPVFVQRREELDREERIAACLFVNQAPSGRARSGSQCMASVTSRTISSR